MTQTASPSSGPAALTINGNDRDLALSPDGTHVVYVGNSGTQLFVRALDALEPARPLEALALRASQPLTVIIERDGRRYRLMDVRALSRLAGLHVLRLHPQLDQQIIHLAAVDAALAPGELLRATFTRLVLVDGRGAGAFEKIDEHAGAYGERVLTYRVRWE